MRKDTEESKKSLGITTSQNLYLRGVLRYQVIDLVSHRESCLRQISGYNQGSAIWDFDNPRFQKRILNPRFWKWIPNPSPNLENLRDPRVTDIYCHSWKCSSDIGWTHLRCPLRNQFKETQGEKIIFTGIVSFEYFYFISFSKPKIF